ncbi:TPA: zinc ribbon domain-containing protein [Cronobacter turicensis]|uniref:zinc ribbon domain-containing protein n=1 Tax=Cronobacter turicensis TaxID=413502 RepID=UPI0024C46744|nr:zinc ribbon domain-containing protein [Cronobacter turicensis]MDK1233715.1 zinc ribbon domain-containing protein [Cronobacter turicensis]HDI3023510.1 zinc ribbon domain-containing protein [Cronobacter turicensis]HDI3035649.1 zinc ribbon domain-containing protein [Cronobacter turicensis]
MEILLVAVVLGVIPALIAHSKGRSFIAWWFYGFLLFIVALVHSLVIKKDPEYAEREMIDDGMKKCPLCAEMVRKEAVKCRHCGSDISGNIHSAKNEKTDEEYLEEARKKAGLL